MGGISMNWRKLIYSIVIPVIVGFVFGLFLSIGILTNATVFFFAIALTIAGVLSSTGHGKNGDAPSTITMGFLATAVTYLFLSLVSELGDSFNWLFVVKTVIFVLVTGFTVYLAKMIMDKTKEKKEGDKNKTK